MSAADVTTLANFISSRFPKAIRPAVEDGHECLAFLAAKLRASAGSFVLAHQDAGTTEMSA